jgi:phosphodiesterase/alkaline phosphatase D-like protein
LRVGRTTTLPATLPKEGEKPFTLLVGSCFYGPEDPDGMVGTTYRHIPRDRRPDVKVLCGDQVYLDNPWRETTLKWYRGNQKPGVFRAMLFRKYLDNWRQVRGEDAGFRHLLANGANYFCSDDHEFWNNAPNFGGVGLVNTLTSKQRRWWLEEARRLFGAFQSPLSLSSFEVPPLSVRVADTRIYRDPKGRYFMKDEDLRAVGRWIEGLRGPGVLVLGQPVLVEKTGFVGSLIRKGVRATVAGHFDKNLPDYVQYEELIGYIRSSAHSIVVLTGDVHFGRIAHGALRAGSRAKLVEVVSSPMQAVLDDKGKPLFGGYKEAPTDRFRGLESIEVARGQNHFATVEFRLGEDGRVNMTVRCWPIPRPGEDVEQRSQTVFETPLP